MGSSNLKQYCCNYASSKEANYFIDEVPNNSHQQENFEFELLNLDSKSNTNKISVSTSKLRLRTLIGRAALSSAVKFKSSKIPKNVLRKMKTLVFSDLNSSDKRSSKNLVKLSVKDRETVQVNLLHPSKTIKDLDSINCSSAKINSFSEKPDEDSINDASKCNKANTTVIEEDNEDIEISEEDENMLRSSISKLFPRLTVREVTMFIENFFFQVFSKDSIIIEGPNTMFLFMIKSGSVGLFKGSDLIKVLTKGDCFGNINIFEKFNPTEDNIQFTCLEQSSLFMISSEQIEGLKKELLEKKHIQFLKILNSIPVIKFLSNQDKLALVDEIAVKKYEKKSYIQQQKEDVNSIFYVLEGQIEKCAIKSTQLKQDYLEHSQKRLNAEMKESKVKSSISLSASSFVNEEILFTRNVVAKHYLRSKGCTVAIISKSVLAKLFGDHYDNYLLSKMFSQLLRKCDILRKLLRELHLKDQLYDGNSKHTLTSNNTLTRTESTPEEIMHYNENNITNYRTCKTNIFDTPCQIIFSKFSFKVICEGKQIMTREENKLILIIKGSVLNVSSVNNLHSEHN